MLSTLSNLFSPRNSNGPLGQAPPTERAQSDEAAQAAAALAARLLEAKHVPEHVPAVLTLLNNIKAGEADPQVVFPGIDDDAQKLTMRINLEHALEVSRDGDELLELVMLSLIHI